MHIPNVYSLFHTIFRDLMQEVLQHYEYFKMEISALITAKGTRPKRKYTYVYDITATTFMKTLIFFSFGDIQY